MADPIRTETLRQEQARLQLEHQFDRDAKELRGKNRNEIERQIANHAAQKADLAKGYEIALSTSKEEAMKRLAELRELNEKRIEEEKTNGEEEADKVRSRYQEQIARYRENSEKQLEDLKRKQDDSEHNIKVRAQMRGRA